MTRLDQNISRNNPPIRINYPIRPIFIIQRTKPTYFELLTRPTNFELLTRPTKISEEIEKDHVPDEPDPEP